MGKHKGFMTGLILGGLLGGIAALMYAPKSGDKMRKDLARKYQSASDKAHDVMESMCARTQEIVDKAKSIAEDAKEVASEIWKENK